MDTKHTLDTRLPLWPDAKRPAHALSLRQAVGLEDPSGLTRLYAKIAEILGCNVPKRDFQSLASELVKPGDGGTYSTPALQEDRALRSRLHDALDHPDIKWRSLRSSLHLKLQYHSSERRISCIKSCRR